MKKSAALALLLLSVSVSAQEGWKDANGDPAPDTESQKSVEGFGGLLVVTPDKDWEEKWTTPETTPEFSSTSVVKRGGELFILTMFTNPKLDSSGLANVTVDIDVKRPDGSSSTHAEGAACFQGEPRGSLHDIRLCNAVVGFVGESSDPAGAWSVRITLKDNVRGVSVPLSTAFELLDDDAANRR